jgi:hypothetical protein
MPYRTVNKTGTRNVTQSRDVVKQDRLGYTEIEVHRPKIMFFEFQGLRPNTPHWIFFGDKQITKYCNTSYSLTDYTSAARDSNIKETGDAYVASTSFPTALGGATNGGANNPLISGSDGSLKGLFYLQSNAALNWNTKTDGTNFSALDVSVMSRNEALSYAATKFFANGQYEDWYQYSVSESKSFSETYSYTEQEFYNDPPSPPANDDPGRNDNHTAPVISYKTTHTGKTVYHNYYDKKSYVNAVKKSGGTDHSANNTFAVATGTYKRSMGGF